MLIPLYVVHALICLYISMTRNVSLPITDAILRAARIVLKFRDQPVKAEKTASRSSRMAGVRRLNQTECKLGLSLTQSMVMLLV